jgi:hypothetical protein
VTSLCGDGKVDPAGGEECDDGNASTELCAYGQTSCAVCGPRCTKAAGIVSYCGDGRLDSTYESCDPGSLPTQVCAYGKTSCSVCGAACVVVSGKTSYCGDGLVDASNGELCDQGAESKDCATPCPFRCGAIAGPKLTEAIDQWPSAGMLIVATEDATLAGFVFNNQGKADTITLTRLSDGVVLGVLGIAAGLSPTLSVDVFWNLEAGQNYALTSSDESNGRWAQYQGTSPVSPGIRVDRVYSPETKETAGLWFTFTEIRSCLR